MKSSPDFQTGSILLLTATLICIGLAITVIAPIIDSPLGRSTAAQTQPAGSPAATSADRQQSLAEFYPPVTRAHHELARTQNSGAAVRNVSNQWTQPSTLPRDSAISPPHPRSTATEFTAFSQSQTSQAVAASTQNVASVGSPARTQLPYGLPAGSVYAPITIHQPPAAVASQATDNEFPLLAERIERLVTERERLAAALEAERDRQSMMTQFDQRKREVEFQQQHIAKLEQQLKSFRELMAKQQSETSAQLTKLADQNSQINVASQAINAYRQALEVAKADAARSAEYTQSHRTAELNVEVRESFETNGDQDDAGRVRIPELPPMPTHQHRQPAPIPTIEQKPQTAEAPMKRLRVSSPVRTFEAVEPEPEPQFLPLPSVNEPPCAEDIPSPDKVPAPIPPPEPSGVTSRTTVQEQEADLKLIPLEAPTIREFQSNLTPARNDIPVIKRQRVPLKVNRQTITQTAPELDVAFEHTYDFKSTTVDATAREMGTSISEVASLSHSFETRTVQAESESTWQFEAIEFPDLSIQPQPLPRRLQASSSFKPAVSKPAAVRPAVANPVIASPTVVNTTAVNTTAVNTTAVNTTAARPTAARPTAARPTAVNTTAARRAMPQLRATKSVGVEHSHRSVSQAVVESNSEETSWLKKFSSPFRRTSEVTQTSHTTSTQPNTGGRGQNRHVQRQTAGQGGAKLLAPSRSQPSRSQPPADIQSPTTEKPNMLQRIGQSFKSLGQRDDK